ncbi:MAG: prolipoprotein diacylglyceryl transferase [Candidatus Omnitrophica bacterium]|nr:prolipoprotein diacylglyceryl transferase [Candidatus Omnitrophota bacterium]
MYPTLLKFGHFTIHSYGLMMAIGFILALSIAQRRARAAGLDPEKIQTLAILALAAGLLGARLAFVALNFPFFVSHPVEVIRLDRGGLVFYGGLTAGIASAVWFVRSKRMPAWRTFDVMMPALVAAHAVGRIGCFLNGCCYGTPSGLPWAVVFPGDSVARHPVQLYETGILFIFYFILKGIGRAGFRPGVVTLSYGLLYGAWRFLIEFLRGDNPPFAFGLTVFQWWSAGAVFISFAMLLSRRPAPASS